MTITEKNSMNTFTWLHLSDFHFRTDNSPKGKVEDFNREIVLNSLLDDLQTYPGENGLKIDFIVITGDIAFSGRDDEYECAIHYFEDVRKIFDLPKKRVFIIPGNHDVNRTKINPYLDQIKLDSLEKINGLLKNDEAKEVKFRRLEGYKSFINEYLESSLPFDFDTKYFWAKTLKLGDVNLGLIGLNSAWNCSGDADRNNLVIGEKQVRDALEKVKNSDLTIALTHHPLDWLSDIDRKTVKPLLASKCDFILHGHLHEAEYTFQSTPDYSFRTIQAGSTYEKRPYSNSYNYVSLNLNNQQGKLHIRQYSDSKSRWIEDSETFKNAKSGVCDIVLNSSDTEVKINIPPRLEIPECYKKWISDHCLYMDLENLMEKGQAIRVELPEIFIPLYTDSLDKKNSKQHDQHKPVNIEDLLEANNYLVIEGQAGSGKTTQMKHIAYSIIQRQFGRGFDDHLPILIFLKELQNYVVSPPAGTDEGGTIEKILTAYFKEKHLDFSTIKNFCEADKAIFLLDGLDELQPDIRKKIVNAFADFRINHNQCRIVFSGRPHGIDSVVVNRTDAKHIKLHSLNMNQVQSFIKKWFEHIYHDGSITAKNRARKMIGEIRSHNNISRLLDNPLMLTAICVLYYDERKLPEQRAELYNKFVNNLIFRRFKKDPEKVSDFLRILAFSVHTTKKRNFDHGDALKVMKKVYPQQDEESARAYRRRLEIKFSDIEENCGLLKLQKNGEFEFWHLTFQEFLTAVYIVDYDQTIDTYWDDPWYKEMIQLHIGYLSISFKTRSNNLIKEQLNLNKKKQFNRWRLAALSLLDIHKDRREDTVSVKAKNRLMEIFESDAEPITLAEAGETLGWHGDLRDLEEFIDIEDGNYPLAELKDINLKNFAISKYPVTNIWFSKFIADDGYKNREFWSPEGLKWLDYTKNSHPLYWYERKWNCPNSPVIGVCWYEAAAFCLWLTLKRNDDYVYHLPSEAQWQAVAAEKDKSNYPWGPKWKTGIANTSEAKIEKTSPVGIFTRGCTLLGKVHDMAGNVWEWTQSDYHSKEIINDFIFDEDVQELYNDNNWDEYFKKFNETSRQLPVLRGGSWYFKGCVRPLRVSRLLSSE